MGLVHTGNSEPEIAREEHTHINGVGVKKVAIVNGSGAQITSFGGGTEYQDGETFVGTPSGKLIMFRGGDGSQAYAVEMSQGLPVQQTINGEVISTSNPAPSSIISDGSAVGTANPLPVDLNSTVASGSTDSGNPVKTGGVYNSTAPTLDDGDRGDIQVDSRGNLKTTIYSSNGTTSLADSTNGLLVNLGANNDVSVSNTVDVNIVGGSSSGVQYTEGDTDATITGTAIMWEDTGNTITPVSASKPLPVSDGGSSITVDGTVAVTNTGLTSLNGAISGSEVQVDIVGALPVGNNNIGDVDIASIAAGDNNIGNVDVLTVPADPFGANSDSAATAGSTGSIQAKLRLMTSQLDAIKTSVETIDNTVGGTELQVDVISMPTTTVQATNLDIRDLSSASDSVAATQSGSWNVGVNAGTNAIGKILPPDVDITTHSNYTKKYYTNSGAVTDGIIWSPASGKRWHVVSIIINVSAACTLTLEDDLIAGDSVVMKMELAANSGVAYNFTEKYPLASGEDAADLLVTTSAGNVYITAIGYEV